MRNIIYKQKASYASSPPCTCFGMCIHVYSFVSRQSDTTHGEVRGKKTTTNTKPQLFRLALIPPNNAEQGRSVYVAALVAVCCSVLQCILQCVLQCVAVYIAPTKQHRTRRMSDWDQNTHAAVIILSTISSSGGMYINTLILTGTELSSHLKNLGRSEHISLSFEYTYETISAAQHQEI